MSKKYTFNPDDYGTINIGPPAVELQNANFQIDLPDGTKLVGYKPKMVEPAIFYAPYRPVDVVENEKVRIVLLSPGFYRVGFYPHRFMLVRADKAGLNLVRENGWKIGNWYLVLGH